MIGLVLGTSEGRDILRGLNKFTQDIFVSTATGYGKDTLKDCKYSVINTSRLDKMGFLKTIRENNINVFIDASHPYAVEATKNVMDACKQLDVDYVRYERPSCLEMFKDSKNVVIAASIMELEEKIKKIEGTILNTTGSNNIKKIMDMKVKNRIVSRVLPRPEAIQKCMDCGVDMEDIVAVKGPVSYNMNCAFINEYKAGAVILKDSGYRGGTPEKIKACIDLGIYALILGRKKISYEKVFYEIDDLVHYFKNKYVFAD